MARRALADGFELDDDPRRIDLDAVYAFIGERSYWAKERSRETMACAVEGSARVIGLYRGAELVGFARVVSDGATLAYLADLFVLEPYRGRGLGLELAREAVEGGLHRHVRWLLHTADASGLYRKLGFESDKAPYPLMERAGAQEQARAVESR
jgi:GNAT superfamily N-acetyltransferase